MGAGWGEGTGQGEREAAGPALQGQWTAPRRGSQQAVGHAGLQLRDCLGLCPGVSGMETWLRRRVDGMAEQRGCAPVSAPSLTGPDIVDIKPANMEDLTEVITASEFHPHHCNLFVYSSSKGSLRLCDMRAAALCDKHSKRKRPCQLGPSTEWGRQGSALPEAGAPGRMGVA